jgi:hypothetical protein
LSEGFVGAQLENFASKLEKFKPIVQNSKQEILKLKEIFEKIQPEIVKLLKKKRGSTPKPGSKKSLAQNFKQKLNNPLNNENFPAFSKSRPNSKLPYKNGNSSESAKFSLSSDLGKRPNSHFQTPLKIKTGQSPASSGFNFFQRSSINDICQGFDFIAPSEFFVMTNIFFKSKHLKV